MGDQPTHPHANTPDMIENGELTRQEVERHQLPSCGRWFWRLRSGGEASDSGGGLDEFIAAHPSDAPSATWDNIKNTNSGSKIFGYFASKSDFTSALLDHTHRTVPHGYELIRKGMDVKAFADFDFKLEATAPADQLHAKAREEFRTYLALLQKRCQEWLDVEPIMYVSDSSRPMPGGTHYKASFHVTITNVVFADVDLKDNWMHSLFLIHDSTLKPDPTVYNSDIRSMRAVTHSKKTAPDAPLRMDFDLSSPGTVRDSLLPTLITYLEDCPTRVVVKVKQGKLREHPRFKHAFANTSHSGVKRRTGKGDAARSSKRQKLSASSTTSSDYSTALTDEQQTWATIVHTLLGKSLVPQLSVGLNGNQVRVQRCSGVGVHSGELRFTTKMIGSSRVCFLDAQRQKVHVSNNTMFFVPDAPYEDAETPVFGICMSTKCKGHARDTLGYISKRESTWSVRANPAFLPPVPTTSIAAPSDSDARQAPVEGDTPATTSASLTDRAVHTDDGAGAAAVTGMELSQDTLDSDEYEIEVPTLTVQLDTLTANISKWVIGLRFSTQAACLLAHIGVSAADPVRAAGIWQTAATTVASSDKQRKSFMDRWQVGACACAEALHDESYDYVAELRRTYLLDDRRRVAEERLTYAEVKDFIEYGLGIFALENPIGYIQTNMDKDSYEMICETKLKVLLRHFQYCDEKTDEFVPFGMRWLNDSHKRFYRRMEFNPRTVLSSKHVFNTFSGFRAAKLRPISLELEEELVRPFCDHLRNVIVGGVEAHADYLLDYMAALVQRPHIKTQVMVLIYGGQGIGKGSLIDFLRKFVLGEKWTQQIQNVDLDLFGQFSSRENTILMQIDEMDDARKHQSALKNLTTADMIRSEKKNVMKEMAKNYLNVIATTNNLTSIHVEATDRRYAFFHAKLAVSPALPGESVEATQERRANERAVYFDNLWGNLNDTNTPRAVYQMLMRRDLSRYQSENAFQLHRPRTAFYKDQQAASIDLAHRFISALANTLQMQGTHECTYKGDMIMAKWTTYIREREPDVVKWPWAPVKHALQNLAGVDYKVSNGVRYIVTTDELIHDLKLRNLHDPEAFMPHASLSGAQ